MSREEIIAANPIVDFVRNRGQELKRAGKNFVTNASPVPQHKRGHRPVMIYPENNSWYDHDLKIGGSVIDWLMHERGCNAGEAMRILGGGNNGSSENVATYDYTDESGNLIFQCVRSKPKDFWQRRPDGKGGWINNLQGARRVLYRLPEVLAASTVCVAEGEKDVDNLRSLDLTATTNPLGAGKWRDEYSEKLRGKNVVIFGDADEPGQAHVEQVIASLIGKAKSIKHVALPDGFHDVSDYIASLPPDKAQDIIRKLIEEAPEQAEHASRRKAHAQRESKKKTSQADGLIKIANGWEFFHTPDHRGFACVPVNGHTETIAVRSRKFRAFLVRTYHSGNGKAASSAAMEEAIAFFEGEALCGEQQTVHTRLAAHGDAIYLDLCNEQWQAVKITAKGWRVVSNPPVKFRRARGMLALPTPMSGGRISDSRRFVNIAKDNDFILLVAWTVAAFRPDLPCPVLVLHGEQGSAKSTTAKLLKKLIDPSEPLLRSLPRDSRDLYIAASNSWVVSLDNVSGLRVWLSDDLCRLATGGGFATRELYSDDEEKIFSALRPVILNGIEEIATRSDLLDRCILLELPMIPKEKRRNEADFSREFEEKRALILGALLDAVACGLKNLPTTRLETCPRIADFATWIVACEPKLGWPAGAFLQAYERNRSEANSVSLDASIIGEMILKIANNGGFVGTASELLEKLDELAPEKTKKQTGWPKNGRAVSGQLKRIAPNLRARGVTVNWFREGGARRIEIQGIGTDG
jgi:hypothetical protein